MGQIISLKLKSVSNTKNSNHILLPYTLRVARYIDMTDIAYCLAPRYTVTPFKFVAIKVRGFEIMTYSRPFNFAVSYQNYFTVSYTNVVFSYTN